MLPDSPFPSGCSAFCIDKANWTGRGPSNLVFYRALGDAERALRLAQRPSGAAGLFARLDFELSVECYSVLPVRIVICIVILE